MNAFNRPKRQKTRIPAAIDVKPLQEKTSEAVRAIQRQRVIANATKTARRTSPKLSSPLPKAHTPKAPIPESSTISTPLVPAFSEPTKAKFDLAVRALKGTRSLSERLTIAAYHLRSDPVLRAIDPREVWKELQLSN
jgi:hypothetical protein